MKNKSFFKTSIHLFLVSTLLVTLVGCSDSSESFSTSNDVDKNATSKTAAGKVSWPKLEEIDHLSHVLMAQMEASDFNGVIENAALVNRQLLALSTDAIPENAQSKTEIKELQDQLKSLTQDFDSLLQEELTPEQQARIIVAFSPVTHKMMRLAGVPHVHGKPDAATAETESHEGHSHEGEPHDDHADHDHATVDNHAEDHSDHDHAEGEHNH
ncbi:MAG: hypothetical protein ACFCU1_05620 [Sumerlaeia bacterium]